jgi:hypothetical protein
MSKLNLGAALLGLACLAAPVAASAVPLTSYGLQQQAGGSGSLGAYEVGYTFRALTEKMSVTELGFFAINPGVAIANLWAASGAKLASVSVTANSIGWVFGGLSAPVDLVQNAVYHVTYYGIDVGYHTRPATSVSTSADIAMVSGRYGDNAGLFPIHDYSDASFADIGYVVAAVPLPAALPMALAGLAALGFVARRRA